MAELIAYTIIGLLLVYLLSPMVAILLSILYAIVGTVLNIRK